MKMLAARSFSIRLLCPMHLKAGGASVQDSLLAYRPDGNQIWEDAELHPKYMEEALRESQRFLCPRRNATFCLRIRRPVAESWFRPVTAVVLNGLAEERYRTRPGEARASRPVSKPISLDHTLSIELFIVHDRVAVLSIPFSNPVRSFGDSDVSIEAVRDLQYHLSHLKYRIPILRIPHPDTDGPLGAPREPAIEKELWVDAPISSRLGRAGQPFTLAEIRDYVLAPMLEAEAMAEQSQFLPHTVLRFDCRVDFGPLTDRLEYARQLASFAQIEELWHAPLAVDRLGIAWDAITTKHLAGYSYLGGCHFVCDQSNADINIPFDEDRVDVVQRKYFTAFLTALTQRLVAHRFLEIAVEKKLECGSFTEIWNEFTSFEASGQLIDVSRRESVNRCYRLAQEAQRVLETLSSLHRVFRDVQASERAEQQQTSLRHQNELQKQQQRMAEEQAETRRRLGLIEVFIVTVYTAELVHILGETGHFLETYVFGGVLGMSLLALATVLQHHHRAEHRGRYGSGLLILSLALLAVWLGGGLLCFQKPPGAETGGSHADTKGDAVHDSSPAAPSAAPVEQK